MNSESVTIETNGVWIDVNEPCPKCGKTHTQYNAMMTLASLPPQYHFKCSCGHRWTGTFSSKNSNFAYKNSGITGWICPVCGAGVAPYQSFCPCCHTGPQTIFYDYGDIGSFPTITNTEITIDKKDTLR